MYPVPSTFSGYDMPPQPQSRFGAWSWSRFKDGAIFVFAIPVLLMMAVVAFMPWR